MVDDSYESESEGDLDSDDLGDNWSWESFPLLGKDWGECTNEAMAQVAFLILLFNDEPIRRSFISWGMQTGIIHAALSAAGILDIIADRYGFPDIETFLEVVAPDVLPDKLSESDEEPIEESADAMADEEEPSDEEEPLRHMSPTGFFAASLGLSDIAESETFDVSDIPEIEVADEEGVISTEALWDDWYAEMADIRKGFDELNIYDKAEQFVNEINCPWPWLVDELVVRFTMMVREVIGGIEAEVVQSVKQTSPLSGHMQQTSSFSSNVLRGTFQQYPGEPEQKFQDRLDHEFSTVRQQARALVEKTMPRGRMPQDASRKRIAQHVTWFYRVRIGKESFRSIANPPGSKGDRRKTVRDAVKKVERLLGSSEEFE